MDSNLPTTSKRHASTSPPAASAMNFKRARINLSEDQLNSLKVNMGKVSAMGMWRFRIKNAEDDSEWRGLLSDVLLFITRELADTDVVIDRPAIDQAPDIVASFNEDELEEWKAAVRNGVEKGDWTDLIEHRMNFLWIIGSHLIIITAKLKKPFHSNESLGVPIDQRMFHCFISYFAILSYAVLENGIVGADSLAVPY
jgi:hypothetical protein